MIATRPSERIGLAPVQERAENHVTISHTFDQGVRDNSVQLTLLTSAGKVDTIADIRRRFLLRDLYESLAILETYCEEDGPRFAFENVAASTRAYVDFERHDEEHEDTNRTVMTGAVAREVKTLTSAARFARKVTPACTGERPDPAA